VITNTYLFYLDAGDFKIVELKGLKSMNNYNLTYLLSSGDFSLNGERKDRVALGKGSSLFQNLIYFLMY
jgi:hypothetical protein